MYIKFTHQCYHINYRISLSKKEYDSKILNTPNSNSLSKLCCYIAFFQDKGITDLISKFDVKDITSS